jgi:hypothetical protein
MNQDDSGRNQEKYFDSDANKPQGILYSEFSFNNFPQLTVFQPD